jgi:hypothetical protein
MGLGDYPGMVDLLNQYQSMYYLHGYLFTRTEVPIAALQGFSAPASSVEQPRML